MRVDDFISFGRTVPEKSKRYGSKVCMAGYSREMRQLIRVYPLPPAYNLPCRSISAIELERNKMDSRYESWTIKQRNPYNAVNIVDQRIEDEQLLEILEKEVVDSIQELNRKRLSLGVIKPVEFEPVIKTRKSIRKPDQLSLFDDYQVATGFKTASDYFQAPYLQFSDNASHTLQLRDWGLYELIRKYESKHKQIAATDIEKALCLNAEREVFLVVGNMVQLRNVWLIIKTFSFKPVSRNLPAKKKLKLSRTQAQAGC